jgi:hypothetical protein
MKREMLAQRNDRSWLILLKQFRGTQTVTKGCNTPDIQNHKPDLIFLQILGSMRSQERRKGELRIFLRER